MNLIFASKNQHKVDEISALLPQGISIKSLNDLDIDDIPETGKTLQENALIKARYVYKHSGKNCFADDTGLEVESLGGAPGVYSARYAGEEKSSEKNMLKLIDELKNYNNKTARFRTVIALIFNDKEYLFDGEIKGQIIDTKRGNVGFGYDPIFVPDGYSETFAELSIEEKNKISHRAMAVEKLLKFLLENKNLNIK